MALSNYLLIAYVTTFLVKSEGFLLSDALKINLIALLVLTLLIPLMGMLSDYIGRKPVFLFGLMSLILFIFPFFGALLSKNWWNAFWGEILFSALLAPLNATIPTIIAEMFPTSVRVSGTSMGYNIGQALFGGTAPLIAIELIDFTGNKLAPAWYILGWTIVVLIAVKFLQESYKKALT